jgi:hypothetical protein
MSVKLKGVLTEERLLELAKSQLIPHYEVDGFVYFGPQETKEWVTHNLVIRNAGKRFDAMTVTVANVLTAYPHEDGSVPLALRPLVGSLIPLSVASAETANMSGIYFLCHEKSVVYVGQSVNVFGRVGAHIGNKTFDRVFFVRVPKQDLDFVEGSLIRLLLPKYNHSKTGSIVSPRFMDKGKDECSNAIVEKIEWARDEAYESLEDEIADTLG